ncbi:hypothetical protein FBUS_06715 [Fasciolopsis buskii]|uniref:PX domain-containing protein n=1 Tax=Fasciolopsis buskii TaxID=27845 RepID=A0A8E0RPM1_9TREM|nr:hypothetical protein FBUS_06715 [Fasciolopsis buski]
MSSCPERSFDSLNDPDLFKRSSSHGLVYQESHSSSESVEAIDDDEFEHRERIDFPFVIKIPTVVLRKHHKEGSHFVYMICVTMKRTIHLNDEHQVTNDHHNASCLQWTVGHRYTTLKSLHADLMGQKPTDLTYESERDSKEIDDQTDPSSNSITRGSRLAHSCLPRPLPGLEYFRFPRKRILPTIPTLAAGRFPACLKNSTDWITYRSAYLDYPVAAGESRRVEQRRCALEQYLNRLVRLVWCISQTTEVDNVLRSMGLPRAHRRETPREQYIGEEASGIVHGPKNDDMELEQLKSRLIGLLPVLSE